MAEIVQHIHLSEFDRLPKTKRCPADLGCDGATVVICSDGSLRVAVWAMENDQTPSIRYSYEVDASGNYVLGSALYSGRRPIGSVPAIQMHKYEGR